MRVILMNLLFFLLPFLGYAGYLIIRKGRIDAEEALNSKAFYWLVAAGALSMVVGLVALATFDIGTPSAVYEPAKYEDGVLKPGYFHDATKPDAPAGKQ